MALRFDRVLSWAVALVPAIAVTLPHGPGSALGVLLVCCIYYYGFLRSRSTKPVTWVKLFPLVGAYFLIFAGALLSVIVNHDHIQALDFHAYWLGLCVVAYALYGMEFNPRIFWRGILFGAYGACALAAWQMLFVAHMARAEGFTNSIPFGDISMMLGVLALLRAPYETGRWRAAYLAGFAAGVMASLLSMTRGGWLILGPLLIYQFVGNPFRVSKRIRAGLTIGALVIAGMALILSPALWQRIILVQQEIGLYFSGKTLTAVGTRITMWRFAWQAGLENIWFGIGPDLYHPWLVQQAVSNPVLNDVTRYTHSHNEWLDVFSKTGVVGVIAVALFFAIPLRALYRFKPAEPDAACARISAIWLIVGYLVFGLSQVMFAHTISILFYGAMLVILWVIAFSASGSGVGNQA